MSYQIRIVPSLTGKETMVDDVFGGIKGADVADGAVLEQVGLLTSAQDGTRAQVGFLVRTAQSKVPALVSMSADDFMFLSQAVQALRNNQSL